MKTMEPTQAPWKIQTIDDNRNLNDSENYRGIKSGNGFFDFETNTGFNITAYMSQADAELIASAPELLKEVEELKKDNLRLRADYSKLTPEQIQDQNYFDLKELRHYYGSWKQLKVVIENLEQEENEADHERYINSH